MPHQGKPCYYCGEPATGGEHAPPECLFSGFDCDSITVPSCTLHNSKKSNEDHAILHAFLIPLRDIRRRRLLRRRLQESIKPLGVDVRRAIQMAERNFHYTKRDAIPQVLGNATRFRSVGLPDISYLPKINVNQWIRQLTAALVWDARQSYDESLDWPGTIVWGPSFFRGLNELTWVTIQDARKVQDDFERRPYVVGWSARLRPYPRAIYEFALSFDGSDAPRAIFRHMFYGRFVFYVIVASSLSTTQALQAAATGTAAPTISN